MLGEQTACGETPGQAGEKSVRVEACVGALVDWETVEQGQVRGMRTDPTGL
jgi:hypothetical protein